MQVYYTTTKENDWTLLQESCPGYVQIVVASLLDNAGSTYLTSQSEGVLGGFLKSRGILHHSSDLRLLASDPATRTATFGCSLGQIISCREILKFGTLIGARNTASPTASAQSLKNGLMNGEGVKADNDKLDWSLLPAKEVEDVVRVLQHGAKKYAADNWKKVPDARKRYFNAAMRHLWAWWGGEKFDEESGLPHLSHAICCFLFCLWFDNNNKNESSGGM